MPARTFPATTLRSKAAVAVLAAVLLGAAAPALAQDAPATGRIPTVTRLVKAFLEREAALEAAVREGHSAAVEAMLADDFELRVAAQPGNPTPRAEWVRLVIAKPGPPRRLEQMAVHDYGDVAVVSFMQASTGRSLGHDIATVDVWKRSGDAWKLAVRFSGPADAGRAPALAVPGAATDPPIEKRY
jgi:hypothetical protein